MHPAYSRVRDLRRLPDRKQIADLVRLASTGSSLRVAVSGVREPHSPSRPARPHLASTPQENRDAVRALKRILKLDRLRLRGPNGARDEFILAATAKNLRKMAKLIPMPTLRLA